MCWTVNKKESSMKESYRKIFTVKHCCAVEWRNKVRKNIKKKKKRLKNGRKKKKKTSRETITETQMSS